MFKNTVLFTIGLMGAIFAAQFPAFYDQYIQRLGGALNEVNRAARDIEKIASDVGKTAPTLIDELLWEGGRNAAIGSTYAEIFDRQKYLTTVHIRLGSTPIWAQLFTLGRYADPDIMAGTWRDYAPGLPVSWAGFFYAAVGFFITGVLYETLLWLIRLPVSYWSGRSEAS